MTRRRRTHHHQTSPATIVIFLLGCLLTSSVLAMLALAHAHLVLA
jgi:hypothetical protein